MIESTFTDLSKKFVVSLFIQEADFKQFEQKITQLGNQKNMLLVVQPCPFEAVEFLYRIDFDIQGHVNSQHEHYFWQSLELPKMVEDNLWKKISEVHHGYLISILQNQTDEVFAFANTLKELLP